MTNTNSTSTYAPGAGGGGPGVGLGKRTSKAAGSDQMSSNFNNAAISNNLSMVSGAENAMINGMQNDFNKLQL